jgi:NAD-dependent dihydropyrimidine dehydrogenase PreA subunit
MAKRISVVISQGQSASPVKRKLEEDLVSALLFEPGVEVTVIPHLYDLTPDGTGMLCLQGIKGDMVLLSWLYPRAAHWILDRNQIKGHFGHTLLEAEVDEDEDEEEAELSEAPEGHGIGGRDLPDRRIYHLDLRSSGDTAAYVEEIRRIAREATVQTVDLLGWIGGSPKPEHVERMLEPAPGNVASGNGHSRSGVREDSAARSGGQTPGGVRETTAGVAPAAEPDGGKAADSPSPIRVNEETGRRWYPVIDYSRCTNCMECLDFCLFGVYGVDRVETILVEQPDNCRKGCPACSRVCPENAIIFPQHKTPAIAGSPDGAAGGFKIDLSVLFGAPDALQQAVVERDVELVAVGRDAVGMSVGIPKRQTEKSTGPKDDLDQLMDQLDDLGL